MISRSNMGKQMTGNRTKKMAKGGKTNSGGSKSVSVSKSSKTATTSKATGREAVGTKSVGSFTKSAGANRNGGQGLVGGIRSAVSNIGQNFKASLKPSPTVTDPKTGMVYDRPNYRGLSVKGLTSKDPANVARNRQAAAMYAAQDAKRRPSEMRRDVPIKATTDTPVAAPEPTVPTTGTGTGPSSGIVMPPPGYRPGIDPEWNYRPQQTVVMKKGGKAKGKKK